MDGSRTHDGSYRPDTDFEDQEAHRDFAIPDLRIIQNKQACNPNAWGIMIIKKAYACLT